MQNRDKQIEEMWKVMQKSNAVTYEPNAHRVDLYVKGQKEKFYVSEQDGHLTIDYGILAKVLYNAGYRKASEVAEEIFAEIEKWLAKDGDIRLITAEKFVELKKKYIGKDTNVTTNTEEGE